MALDSDALRVWQDLNRAPMFHNKVNRWVVVVSNEFAGNEADVQRAVQGLLKRVERGAADDVKVLKQSATRINPKQVLRTRGQLPATPAPKVKDGPVTYALVEFAWRSAVPDIPWPAERFAVGMVATDDPTDADIVLDSVAKPEADAKPPRSPFEKVVDNVEENVEEALQEPVTWALLAVLGGGLAWWAISKSKG